jgi:glycosyltransferase involved in cell wall biosynthesis
VRLLLYSRFFPSVGGIETVAALLTREWIKAGVEITVVTNVRPPSQDIRTFPFRIVYRPSPLAFLGLVKSHDVFMHFNISLRALWPLILVRRPFVAVHHGFYIVDRSGRRDWRERLKLRLALHAAANIAVSKAIASELGIACTVIPNPYDAQVFCDGDAQYRDRDLIFVGRLVSDKGVHLLIDALAVLKRRGLQMRLTIVGDGPDRSKLEGQAAASNIDQNVKFLGHLQCEAVAGELRKHKILIVPSLIREGFGVVALEAIGCGCVVIGSDSGGLPEAIGECGLVIRPNDPELLLEAIERVLRDMQLTSKLKSNSEAHLAHHSPEHVAKQYLNTISQVLSK